MRNVVIYDEDKDVKNRINVNQGMQRKGEVLRRNSEGN